MADHALLHADDHRDLRVTPDRGDDDAVMSSLIVTTEFRRVQGDYPILFRRTPERERFQALAMFGFEPGENLFRRDMAGGTAYRPLAMRIRPFLIGQARDGADKQVHIDLDSPRVMRGGEGVRVFDELGRATPFLEEIAGDLGELDDGWQRNDGFFDALARHELIEPLTLEITLADGSINRLVGYHAIAEERLQALDAAALGELQQDGHLLPIFMAIASLAQVNELIARKNAGRSHG